MAESESGQETLDAFTAGTTAEKVTQTVVLPLETSNRKNEKVKTAIDEFQRMCVCLGNHMPSLPDYSRSAQNPTLYRIVTREFPKDERTVGSKVALAVTHHVAANYESWQSNGKNGERPTFGNGNFFQLPAQDVTIEENDRGYSLKANFIPYKPEWWHINPRPYVRDYLERIYNGDASFGTAEFRLGKEGGLTCHLPVSWDVEVYEPGDVTTIVGVDIGETAIYAAAVVSPDGIEAVEIKSGREFRHYRERLKDKKAEMQQKGDLRGMKKSRNQREKYTEQVLDTASREIVDLAAEHQPAKIALEDLTNYRETAKDPIHDWPFALLQEKIAYKAKAAGIPLEIVNPRNTSITCRQCGQTNPDFRDGVDFECTRCGYQVHADLNAAINIAKLESTD